MLLNTRNPTAWRSGFIPSRNNAFIAMLIVAGLVTCAMTIKSMLGDLLECGSTGFAVVASAIVAVDLWMIASDAPFVRRAAIAFLATSFIGLGVPLGEYFAGPDWKFHTRSWDIDGVMELSRRFGVGRLVLQRICATSLVAFASFFFHVCLRRRLTFRLTPMRTQITVRDILLLIVMLAAATAIARNSIGYEWSGAFRVVPEKFSTRIAFAALFLEVGVLFVCVFGPVVVSFHSQYFGVVQLLWPSAIGAVIWIVAPQFSLGASVATMLAILHAVFAVTITALLLVARRYGLRMAIIPKVPEGLRDDVPSPSLSACKPMVRFAIVFTLAVSLAISTVNRFVDFETLLVMPYGSKYETARKVARISKLLGSRPWNFRQQVSWDAQPHWQPKADCFQGVQIEFDPAAAAVSVVTDRYVREILLLAPTSERLVVNIVAPVITPEMVQPLFGRTLPLITIGSAEIDPQALDDLCRYATIASLTMGPSELTIDHVVPLRNHKALTHLHLTWSPVSVDQVIIDALAKLPLVEASFRFRDSSIDLSALRSLESLELHDSQVDETVVSSIKSPLRPFGLKFVDCQFTADGLKALAKHPVEKISIVYERHRPHDVGDFLLLADPRKAINFDGESFDEVFYVRFSRLGGSAESCFGRLRPFVDLLSECTDCLGFDEGVERVAHSFQRDANGNLIEVDLQLFYLKHDEGLRLLREHAPHLKRLRVGNVELERRPWQMIASFPELETLELPGAELCRDTYKHLGQIKTLRRLQLPAGSWNSSHLNRVHWLPSPEEMGFERWPKEQFRWVAGCIQRHSGFRSEKQDDLEDGYVRDFRQLAELRNLEYLFMPGFALFEKTLPTIESFSKLETLHAPFSYLTNDELKRIAALQQIRDLAVGSDGFSEETAAIIGSMQHLSSLRLFVFDNIEFNSSDQERIHRRLSVLLPKCQVRVYLLPSID